MTHHEAEALGVLGEIDLADGRRADAIDRLERSVALWRTRGWVSYLAATLRLLGTAYGPARPDAARAAWAEARGLFAGLGNDAQVADLDTLLGAQALSTK